MHKRNELFRLNKNNIFAKVNGKIYEGNTV